MARFLWWLFPGRLHILIDKYTGWVIVQHTDRDTHEIWYLWERGEEYRARTA